MPDEDRQTDRRQQQYGAMGQEAEQPAQQQQRERHPQFKALQGMKPSEGQQGAEEPDAETADDQCQPGQGVA